MDVIFPAVRAYRAGHFAEFKGKYESAWRKIRQGFEALQGRVVSVLVMSLGVGIAFSNLLTRNNKADKYLVCVLLALFLLKSLGQNAQNRFYLLGRALVFDLLKLTGKKDSPLDSFVSISFFVPFFGSTSYTDPKGYIIGGVVLLLGVGMSFLQGSAVKGNKP